MNSTIGIEASIFKKPVFIILSSKDYLLVDDYINEGIAFFVNSKNEIELKINELKDNSNRIIVAAEKFVNKYLCNKGRAVEKIVKYIVND